MKRRPVLTVLLIYSLTVSLFACDRGGGDGTALSCDGTITPDTTTRETQSKQTGTPGAAAQRAVINVKDIANQEKLSPSEAKTPKAIHRPLSGPDR
jgi:hypothetical protein